MSNPAFLHRSALEVKAPMIPRISSTVMSAGNFSILRFSSMEAMAPQRWMASVSLKSPWTTKGSARFTT